MVEPSRVCRCASCSVLNYFQRYSYTEATAFDNPHVTTLLPDGTVEIHNIDTQTLVQTVPPPTASPSPAVAIPTDRKAVLACAAGFCVPSAERQSKLRPTPVKLRRPKAPPASVAAFAPEVDAVQEPSQDPSQEPTQEREPAQVPSSGQEKEQGTEQRTEQGSEKVTEQEKEEEKEQRQEQRQEQETVEEEDQGQEQEQEPISATKVAEEQEPITVAERAGSPECSESVTVDVPQEQEKIVLTPEIETKEASESGQDTGADEPTPYDLEA